MKLLRLLNIALAGLGVHAMDVCYFRWPEINKHFDSPTAQELTAIFCGGIVAFLGCILIEFVLWAKDYYRRPKW